MGVITTIIFLIALINLNCVPKSSDLKLNNQDGDLLPDSNIRICYKEPYLYFYNNSQEKDCSSFNSKEIFHPFLIKNKVDKTILNKRYLFEIILKNDLQILRVTYEDCNLKERIIYKIKIILGDNP